MERKIKHRHILLGLVVALILISSGCASKPIISSEDKPGKSSETDKVNGIEIILPIKDVSGYVIHSEDIEALYNELLSMGATQVEIEVESEDKTDKLSSPSDLCEGNHEGTLKIYAQGDYDDLSKDLAAESSYLSKLKNWGIDVDIKPYIKSP
ncbi:MAG: hypothetical protein GX176_09815 [Syntrophomonadaceae bacterium]|jgi:hypothetical protein|nr:hypothetical protein [Syntrophomonadaceae bacterium]